MAHAFEGHLYVLQFGEMPSREDFESAFRRVVPSGQYSVRGPAANESELDFGGEFDAKDLHDFVTQLAECWEEEKDWDELGFDQCGELARLILATLGFTWI